jgi:hypothetical protein
MRLQARKVSSKKHSMAVPSFRIAGSQSSPLLSAKR